MENNNKMDVVRLKNKLSVEINLSPKEDKLEKLNIFDCIFNNL